VKERWRRCGEREEREKREKKMRKEIVGEEM